MFKNNFLNLIFALLIAIITWFFVTTSINPETIRTFNNITIKFLNENEIHDKGLSFSNPDAYQVNVTVKGKRSDIIALSSDEVEATIDLTGFIAGDNLAVPSVTVPDNINVINTTPADFTIKLVKNKKVVKSITVAFSNVPTNKTNPKILKIAPEKIEISGTKKDTDKVEQFEADIDYKEYEQGKRSFEVEIYPVDKNGDLVKAVEFSQTKTTVTLK